MASFDQHCDTLDEQEVEKLKHKQKHKMSEEAENHNEKQADLILKKFLKTHKSMMKKKAECIFEGMEESEVYLDDVYTELFITEGDMKDVNQEHEILKNDDAFKKKQTQDKPIKCNDIFIELGKNNKEKIVLTKGIAGIGKTVSVHKFILDWLAFEQLKKEKVVFDEKDLKECGIDVIKDNEFTGMIAEIIKKESVLHVKKVFHFVHLSVQEFFAAMHVFLCYMNKNMQELQFFFDEPEENVTLHELLQKAIVKAMKSQKGHLDLFLRFLMGISLESSQKLFKDLITHTEDTTTSIRQTIQYIKRVQDGFIISEEASVNLFYCLLELEDHSLYEEIQRYVSSNEHPDRKLSSSMCTVLTYILLMSEKVLDEFNPKRFTLLQENYKRLVPAVRGCRKALFDGCGLDETCCETVSSALQSSKSYLTELDLSCNDLRDSGVNLLYGGLKSSHCQLKILRFSICNLTTQSCESLSSVLQLSASCLRELDLSNNDLEDSG
ncbi:hypothetical protein QQF64_023570, partial [Cirrhinus molitorella]